MKSLKRVTIIQYRLLHYRLALFEQLRDRCEAEGIELHLVTGQPSPKEAPRQDTGELPWAETVRNRFCNIHGVDLLWQPLPRKLRDSNLIVVMQENRIISNYPLLINRIFGKSKVAFWGHGRNFQSRVPGGLREKWKAAMLTKVDWWFAYTEMTRQILKKVGFPDERITVLNNAIDNEGFKLDLAQAGISDLSALRKILNLEPESRLGIYCGSLYEDKKIDLLIEAASRIHQALPDFRLAILGDGPEGPRLSRLIEGRPWVSWLGQKRGFDKAACFELADITLNPGAVGLHVLDSFCAKAPMITTSSALHGPEIAYLRHGENGLIVDGTTESYANAAISLLQEPDRMQRMQGACSETAKNFTMEAMCQRFLSGISSAIASPKMH